MWKKVLVFSLMIVLVTISAQAQQLMTYVSDNTTGAYTNTFVSTSRIYPQGTSGYDSGDRILGFAVYDIALVAGVAVNSENVAALHDASSSYALGALTIEAEIETVDDSFDGMWFPKPRKIYAGVCIRQGPCTRVIIYYERG